RTRTHARADQSALAAALPRQRRRLERPGVREGLLVQGGAADGPCHRMPRLVRSAGPMGLHSHTRVSLAEVRDAIVSCDRCPRLRAYCAEVARVKRRAFRDEAYWGKPVPGFGDQHAGLLLIGLAPAAHRANPTRPTFSPHSTL